MNSTTLNDPISLDDLIAAYLRFKEWMDYDSRRSAYSAKEIEVLQKLFGISYVTIPADLNELSYEELLDEMYERQQLISAWVGALDELDTTEEPTLEQEEQLEELLQEIDKTSHRTTVHYFRTLHEAIQEAANVVMAEGDLPESSDLYEDQFRGIDEDEFEEIRNFMLAEHPSLATMTFPRERAYEMGLPRTAPGPIDHSNPNED